MVRAPPLPLATGTDRAAPLPLLASGAAAGANKARVATLPLVGRAARAAPKRLLAGGVARERRRCGCWPAGAAAGRPLAAWAAPVRLLAGCAARGRPVLASACKMLDVLASVEDAGSMFGWQASHPFVCLARILQATCDEIQRCTSSEVLLTVTASQVDVPGGVLLSASGFLDRAPALRPSAQVEAQLAVGVDSMVSAVRQVATENKRRAADGINGDAGAPEKDAMADGRVTGADGVAAGPFRGGTDGKDTDRFGDDGIGRAGGVSDDQGAAADDEFGDVADLTDLFGPSDGGDAGPSVSVERTRDQPARPPDTPSAAPEKPARSDSVAAPAARASGNAAGVSGSGAHAPISDYVLPSTFVVPGLTVAPARIQLPSTRGGVRFVPPEPAEEVVNIADLTVQETIKQLSVPTRDDSLRNRLVEFTSLYKYVIDHLVKRSCVDPEMRDTVNHPYVDVTPDAVRGKKVNFLFTKSKRVSVLSPTFRNSRATKVTSSLAVVLLMKHRGDPFFFVPSGPVLRWCNRACRLRLGAQGRSGVRREAQRACSTCQPLEGQEAGPRFSSEGH